MKKQISYSDLAKKLGAYILFNQLPQVDENWVYGFIVSPMLENDIDNENNERETEEGEDYEPISVYDYAEGIYQTFMVTDQDALMLYNHTDQLISYSEKLDAFFWHVCHYGTSWTHVHCDWEDEPEDDIWDVTKLANMTHG